MRELMEKVAVLVREERERANEVFPMFASDHEGFAVILEEVAEMNEEVEVVNNALADLIKIVCNDLPQKDADLSAKQIAYTAVRAACEAIQVAAMAKKFIVSRNERDETSLVYGVEVPTFVADHLAKSLRSGKRSFIAKVDIEEEKK